MKQKVIGKKLGVRLRTAALSVIISIVLAGCKTKEPVFIGAKDAAQLAQEQSAKEQSTQEQATQEQSTQEQSKEQSAQELSMQEEPAFIYLHICGAVRNPGVYRMEAGSRIFEAVALAGGFTEDASIDYQNQAEPVSDGQQIRILTVEEAMAAPPKTDADTAKQALANQTSTGMVNINTADTAQLCTLPGIGEGKALAIIAYRKEQGVFQRIEDILQVDGIKSGTYEKIKEKITIS